MSSWIQQAGEINYVGMKRAREMRVGREEMGGMKREKEKRIGLVHKKKSDVFWMLVFVWIKEKMRVGLCGIKRY